MKYTLNNGMVFSKEYESDCSIVRRFLVANPGITRQDLRKSDDRVLTKSLILQRILEAQNKKYLHDSPWIFAANWLSDSRDVDTNEDAYMKNSRQCPKCALELFHTHAFNNAWIEYCPIHGCEIAFICPECGQYWPNINEIFPRKCSTCGRGRAKSSIIRQAQSKPHSAIHNESVNLIWRINRGIRDYNYIIYHDYINDGIDGGVLKHEGNYPDIHVTLMPEYSSMFKKIGCEAKHLKSKKFNVHPINEDDLKTVFNISQDRIIEKAVTQSLKDLEHVLSKDAAEPGYVKGKCRRTLPCLDYIHECSPVYIAKTIWKSIIKPCSNGTNSGKWWKPLFDDYRIAEPKLKSLPVAIYDRTKNVFYQADNKHKEWMCLMNVKYLFIYIYHSICIIQYSINGNVLYVNRYAHTSDKNELSDSFRKFKIRVDIGNHMKVAYDPFPTWSELFDYDINRIAAILGNINTKSNYHRYCMSSGDISMADQIRFELNSYE